MIGARVITAMSIEVKVATTRGWCMGVKGTLVEVGTSDTLNEYVKQRGIPIRECWYRS